MQNIISTLGFQGYKSSFLPSTLYRKSLEDKNLNILMNFQVELNRGLILSTIKCYLSTESKTLSTKLVSKKVLVFFLLSRTAAWFIRLSSESGISFLTGIIKRIMLPYSRFVRSVCCFFCRLRPIQSVAAAVIFLTSSFLVIKLRGHDPVLCLSVD